MTNHDPLPDDDAVDALLSRHFSAAAGTFEPPVQPSISALLPAARRWHRWRAPSTVAGGLIAAATATVLVLSAAAPPDGPGMAVAPSGSSVAASSTPSSMSTASSTVGISAAAQDPALDITVSGTRYTLGGAVPWYSAMRIGRTVAVSTGPEVRGACDDKLYRLSATRASNGELVLTSYQYNPPKNQAQPSCLGIGLPPYVAVIALDEMPSSTVRDGARPSESALPLTQVLVPSALPDGAEPDVQNPDFPQLADPDGPSFPARSYSDAGRPTARDVITQSYSSRGQRVSVRQGVLSFGQGRAVTSDVPVGNYRATLYAESDSPEQCVHWTDAAAGKVEVCGTLNGGADALVAVARSMYPSATPDGSEDGAGDSQILVGGVAYRRVGAVPWLRATAHRNQVSVVISALNGIACQEAHDLFRVEAARPGEVLELTVTHYIPVEQQKPDCSLILRPPFVTALDLGSPVTETSAVDGSQQAGSTGRAPKPLVRVLLPSFLPDGFALGTGTRNTLLLHDPDRPTPIGVSGAYDAAPDSAITRYGSANTGLSVTQGIALYDSGKFEQRTTIHGQPAVVVLDTGSRCVRWQEPDIGPLQVCSMPIRSGGKPLPADVMIKIAQSLTA